MRVTVPRATAKTWRQLVATQPKADAPLTTPDVRTHPKHFPWNPTSSFPPYPSPQAKFESDKPPTHWLVTKTRSTIGLTQRTKDIIKTLGLTRRHSQSLIRHSAKAAGNILKVKELIKVRNVTHEYGRQWLNRTKSMGEGAGVQPTGRLVAGGKHVPGEEAVKQ